MDTHAMLAGGLDVACDLTMTRLLPAAPEAVFAAWIEAEQARKWWGPYGMTVPVCEIDLRPGGTHRTVMRDAAGAEYPSTLVFEEIAAPSRLVLRADAGQCGLPDAAVGTITFAPDQVGTRLTVHWRHASPAGRQAHADMGFVAGWGQTLDRLAAHVMAPPPGTPFAATPAPQHGWLTRLLGDWRYESECEGPPGAPPMRATGVERVRMLGGFWCIGESEGTCPGTGGPVRMVITMGCDPATGRFRGTFVGSMMAAMFVYDGTLDESATTVVLDTEGPAFDGPGTARYRDSVTMQGDATRLLASEVQRPDGSWHRFMTGRYERVG
ncbi:MAG: DUF1579 family protein [Acetobacteraceae bacterium]|nr:DUF1579 family protein [Acetobacteraceae bacterium]